MTPEQSRAARGWLDISQTDLARRANVSLSTVRDFEKGRRWPIANNMAALERVFGEAGIEFLFEPNGSPAGMALRDAPWRL
jgi:transcriptional regulator with XRE-family HTH domain